MKFFKFTFALIFFLCLFTTSGWSKSAYKSDSFNCIPFDLCGTWVGCAKINQEKKLLIGTDYPALCREGSPITTTIDEKTKIKYLTQTACFRSQPTKIPPPENICPESCKKIPDCPSGAIHFAY